MDQQFRRSALARELYEFLQGAERRVTCVRSLAGPRSDWELVDAAVKSYVDSRGLYAAAAKVMKVQVDPTNDGGLQKLRGQHGAAATEDFDAGLCVGQYVGDEMLDVEFERLYPWPHDRWYAAMHLSYDKGINDRTFSRFFSKTPEPLRQIPNDIVLTVAGNGTLAFVNDCRADMTEKTITPADEARRNADFVYCDVDGALVPFLVTLKPVPKGHQLLAYYGPHFLLPNDDNSTAEESSLSEAMSSSELRRRRR